MKKQMNLKHLVDKIGNMEKKNTIKPQFYVASKPKQNYSKRKSYL